MTKAQQVGRRIAQARREKAVRDGRDIKPAEVARAIGVSGPTYSEYESGKIVPRDGVMERLAAYLGVTPAYLRYGVGETVAPPSVPEVTTHDVDAVRERQRAKRAAAPPEPQRNAGGDRGRPDRRPKPR
jgi:transcriptional regulator with XRE-family HTH domain